MKRLKTQGTRGLALVLLFVCSLVSSAATATKKKGATAKKPAASTTTHKTSTASSSKKGSTTAKKGTPTARKGTSTAAARRRTPAAPPRQNTPTPERYREIQQALVERGYTDSTPDGLWNSQWVDSLRRFQADQNLEVDGKLGALSLIALGLGPKRQALQLPPPGASNQTTPAQQLLAKPVE